MIKKLIIAILILLPTLSMANPKQDPATNPINQKLNEIFYKLRDDLGVSPKVYMVIAADSRVNAETDGSTVVYVTKGMVYNARQNGKYGAIAAVIGHELAHIKLRHSYGDQSLARSKQNELDADKVGVQAAIRNGYNGMEICTLMEQMRDAMGDPPANDPHPSFKVRMDNIGCGR